MAFFWIVFALSASVAIAQSASTNRVPPYGIPVPPEEREFLQTGIDNLAREINNLRARPALSNALPDVQIFHKAVHWALAYNEFYKSNEVTAARKLLEQGLDRAKALANDRAPWANATGLVVRAYRSRIDQSIQPYGLVVPPNFLTNTAGPYRLDVWLHGRDNLLTEVKFLTDRQRSYGEFAPADTFVLHPYGRYCNAFKFAGEIDVFEALEHVRQNYPIDETRITIRGFSMGGGGTWHLASHYPGYWAAAAPGAGFAETAEFQRIFSRGPKPTWYDQALWHLYDATDYAGNFFNCPVIAYSGELDRQRQAAEIMARAMRREGLELTHLIGPKTEHKYEPTTKIELERQFSALLAQDPKAWPRRVRFTTWTLRYNSNYWVTVDGLEKHWQRADVDAQFIPQLDLLRVTTTNVSALTLALPPTEIRNATEKPLTVLIDSTRLPGIATTPVHVSKSGTRWKLLDRPRRDGLRKRPGLQGPIDDVFMDSFIMVRPTGKPMHATSADWIAAEMAHAASEWRNQFRGDPIMKPDTEITDADIAHNHLILWGDPQSNKVLARMAGKLPVRWYSESVRMLSKDYVAARFVPVLIYPNPLNPSRYVVLNSGFTFCEYGRSSNALQIPKLPDYAILDVSVPRESRYPNGVLAAGFFDERWRID
ncbi:MAG: prolyl oligopeptidase family serine peptidase [Verrucomicrobia subdivision 3 bacterium]|nr:prolyl oligopeptidase family serine peptidase [Limisphaerales bacterium]